MAYLNYSCFPGYVTYARPQLEKIGAIIGKYLGENEQKNFLTSCTNLEYVKANHLIKKLVHVLTTRENIDYDKFVESEKNAKPNPLIDNPDDIAYKRVSNLLLLNGVPGNEVSDSRVRSKMETALLFNKYNKQIKPLPLSNRKAMNLYGIYTG